MTSVTLNQLKFLRIQIASIFTLNCSKRNGGKKTIKKRDTKILASCLTNKTKTIYEYHVFAFITS